MKRPVCALVGHPLQRDWFGGSRCRCGFRSVRVSYRPIRVATARDGHVLTQPELGYPVWSERAWSDDVVIVEQRHVGGD